MGKKILGLDLGTTSIGWALVNEAESDNEESYIIKLGVRLNPLTVDEQQNFKKGKSITTNAKRTLKRSIRRNLQRYKLRRENLIEILKEHKFISEETNLSENGNYSTFETYRLRAKAASEKISLEQFARVLLMLNKKRGYKSSRKAKGTEEGSLIDGMEIAKKLYNENLTPGQFCLQLLNNGEKYLPDFYRSDLQEEFYKIWHKQKEFYADILTDELKEKLHNKNEKTTWAILQEPFKLIGVKRTTKGDEQKKENFEWRVKALTEKMNLESLAIVLQKINSQINSSSGYLGEISDRSKELYFNKQTVGQYQMSILDKNPNASLRNMVFYRQDYLDEFNTIWDEQAKYHEELTQELKKEIRDVIIFFQRRLKSKKGLISFCEFENRKIEIEKNGKKITKIVGSNVIPRSSPLFQEFRIWQKLNDIEIFPINEKNKKTKPNARTLELKEKNILFSELSIKEKLSKAEILALLDLQDFEMNFNNIEGNKTQAELFKAYQKIIELWGYNINLRQSADKILTEVSEIFKTLNYNRDILYPNTETLYKFWHLLYSFEGDKSNTGNEKLISKLKTDYGFERKAAVILAGVVFLSDYGNLSAKAIKKILPHLKTGEKYDVACALAGYKHSASSLTKEEIEKKIYKYRLDIIPKNHLRNPVVEKILNQMINVINAIIDTYGKPDEIRIELARELKKSAKEREELTEEIDVATKKNEEIKTKLQKEFGLTYVTQNDIIRYKLYEELKNNGYRTLYSNTYIPQEKLFSKEFDVDHIIPQSRLFDDSFSNKTLEVRSINIEKGNQTAFDYVKGKGYDNLNIFLNRIISVYGKKNEKDFAYYKTEYEKSLKKKETREKWNKLTEAEQQIHVINKYYSGKIKKLIITGEDIPEDFINRDLSDTRYIARYAKTMLENLVKNVVSTSGSITKRLREDWQLVDVMKELNWDKYEALQLIDEFTNRDGKIVKQIRDWTKRNDHRHHAVDALIVAFTKRQYVQYLNNLNARSEKNSFIYSIEQKELYRDDKGKLLFKAPLKIKEFRAEVKKHLENTLISIKAKNKVATKNVNITKKKNSINKKVQLTPRGQLHLETVYGSQKKYTVKVEKIGTTFDEAKIKTVCKPAYKNALLKHLQENKDDPKKAFGSKNTLTKYPIYIDEAKTLTVPEKVKTIKFETVYTIRKEISPDLFKDAKKKDIFEKALGEATNLSEKEIDKAYDKAIEFIFDKGIRKILIERYKKTKIEIEDYNKRVEKKEQKKVLETAFSNLNENPIMNKNGKSIKRVTISGISNVQALHTKKDHNGKLILDENCKIQAVDFVNTGSNHHVAIFRDKEGNLQENVVSFYEAVTRRNLGLPIIDKEFNKKEGWQFLFSMKQNEYFVFPNEKNGFSPQEIDLLNPDNYSLISPNLFRVQKISTKNYMFRHHLDTSVSENKLLRKVTWELIQTPNKLEGIIKVRLNHIGQIVYVGEY